jgi:hypothetical protein
MIQPGDAELPKGLKKFEGYKCPTGLPDEYVAFDAPAYVFVSGSGGNPWGHCLLLLGEEIGYVHAAQPGKHKALFIPSERFQDYMHACRKIEWERKPIELQLDQKQAARLLLHRYLTEGFNWQPWHDCVTMVDRIANAGGSEYIANTVFPSKAVKRIRRGNVA